jgi:hypothetical protein
MRAVAIRALAVLAVSLAAGGCGSGAEVGVARNFGGYPIYWVGDRFEGLELERVSVGAESVSVLVYGTCTTDGERECEPPLEIRIQQLCEDLDEIARNPIWKSREVRGAPVGMFEGAPVLFGERTRIEVRGGPRSDAGLPFRALRALRSLNDVTPVIDSRGPIPAPAREVLDGRAPCAS